MQKAKKLLAEYIPQAAVDEVVKLLYDHKELYLKITRQRTTKLGDYKKINKLQHRITINYNLNPYQFLLTLLHEVAHFLTYKRYGTHIKPHGNEWKQTFSKLLQNYIKPEIFPKELLPALQKYARNPKASTAGDGDLYLLLSQYNTRQNPNAKYIFQLQTGQIFALPNGSRYQLQEKRRTRYKCLRLDNQKIYLIHQNAEVYPINSNKQNENHT